MNNIKWFSLEEKLKIIKKEFDITFDNYAEYDSIRRFLDDCRKNKHKNLYISVDEGEKIGVPSIEARKIISVLNKCLDAYLNEVQNFFIAAMISRHNKTGLGKSEHENNQT